MEKFYKLVKRLRKECPWDAEQNLKTLIPFLIEETYELIDAINKNDRDKIVEELGDVLLNIFMQMVIVEEGQHKKEEILNRITKKIVNRHPHIFGNVKVKNKDEVAKNWQKIKKKERPDTILSGVPMTLPSLLLAQRLQKIASSVGFDWSNIDGVLNKLTEELDELKEAKTQKQREEEFGDVLFVLAHLGNFLKIDAETALRQTCHKFKKRFNEIEKGLKKKGKTFTESNLEEMESFWQKAKKDK
ncbi:MAG: nucleoside triphosphate pyrophosphohydrolase [Candidatus Cloacimonas sp. 4484_209]|nr:MAG: nucleoside triphosphate pyrophosphohydrolase [Candidatus Cloacimonas sp. 4484_209]